MIDPDFLYVALKEAQDDWVSFADMKLHFLAAVGHSKATEDRFWSAIELLLQDQYFVAGEIDIENGFVSWTHSAEEAVAAMKVRTADKSRLYPGDVCWFDVTQLGIEKLHEIENACE